MSLAQTSKQAFALLRRRYRARQLRIPYTRSRDFTLPREMWLNGTICTVHAPDEGGTTLAFSDIFLDDVYGVRQIGFPVNTVLDIGAHSGFFSLFARSLFPRAKIHCYEPNPQLHRYLKTQARNGSFELFGEAVGAAAGRVTVVGAADSVSTTVQRSDAGSVTMVSLRDAIKRLGGSVDLLKLDCEGGEWEMFDDSQPFRSVRYLAMEYHLTGGHTLNELLAKLSSIGFRVLYAERNDLTYGLLRAVKRDM